MPDTDITKMIFLGIREKLADSDIAAPTPEQLEAVQHPWKAFSREKEFGDSTGKPVLCWDALGDIMSPTYIYLGYRVTKSFTSTWTDDTHEGPKIGVCPGGTCEMDSKIEGRVNFDRVR